MEYGEKILKSCETQVGKFFQTSIHSISISRLIKQKNNYNKVKLQILILHVNGFKLEMNVYENKINYD
jgi:hypothetical protein